MKSEPSANTRSKDADIHSFHIDQYKMLREELMQNIREIYRAEMAGAIGAASLYTWLLIHKQDEIPRAIWFVAPCLILICATRCLDLWIRIHCIARYLKRIEEECFGQDSKLPGWERYKYADRKFEATSATTAAIVWSLAFIGSIIASWLLSR